MTVSTVVDEKTKERKENGLCDGNFPNGDDPSLIQSAAKMVLAHAEKRNKYEKTAADFAELKVNFLTL